MDKYLVKTLKDGKAEKAKREFIRLERVKNSKRDVTRIFKLKNEIVGSKKSLQEPTSGRDPITGEIEMDPAKIKENGITFCENFLTNRDPSPGC